MAMTSLQTRCKTRQPLAGKTRREVSKIWMNSTTSCLTNYRSRAIDLAKEKSASTWLTVRPLKDHGFSLHTSAFHNALALWYGWTPSKQPLKCECGNNFTVEYTLSCARGGFPTIRHDEIRDLTAHLLREVCNDVRIEPELQPVPPNQLSGATANSQYGARIDISANSAWEGRHENVLRRESLHAPSNKIMAPSVCYRKHEREKNQVY